MPAKKPWRTDWSRSFVVYCPTAAQKKLLQEEAEKRNRTLSNYALHSLLSSAGSDRPTPEDPQAARDEATRCRRELDLAHAKDAKLSKKVDQIQAQLDELLRGRAAPVQRDGADVRFVDPEALRTIVEAHDGRGYWLPVNERDLIIALDRITDPAFVTRLREDLAALAECGLVERRSRHSRTYHRWTGDEPEARANSA